MHGLVQVLSPLLECCDCRCAIVNSDPKCTRAVEDITVARMIIMIKW